MILCIKLVWLFIFTMIFLHAEIMVLAFKVAPFLNMLFPNLPNMYIVSNSSYWKINLALNMLTKALSKRNFAETNTFPFIVFLSRCTTRPTNLIFLYFLDFLLTRHVEEDHYSIHNLRASLHSSTDLLRISAKWFIKNFLPWFKASSISFRWLVNYSTSNRVIFSAKRQS